MNLQDRRSVRRSQYPSNQLEPQMELVALPGAHNTPIVPPPAQFAPLQRAQSAVPNGAGTAHSGECRTCAEAVKEMRELKPKLVLLLRANAIVLLFFVFLVVVKVLNTMTGGVLLKTLEWVGVAFLNAKLFGQPQPSNSTTNSTLST